MQNLLDQPTKDSAKPHGPPCECSVIRGYLSRMGTRRVLCEDDYNAFKREIQAGNVEI